MTLENPIRAIREISHDLTCRRRVRLANGRMMSALDIQREYFERAQDFSTRFDLGVEQKRALQMWGYCLERLEQEPLSLDRECDWVINHDVSRQRGLFYKMQQRDMVESICLESDVIEAMHRPPQTTRARLRGEFVRRAKERKRDYTVDWVHLKLNDQAQRTVLCKDPFKSHDERVEKLIASL